MEHIYRDESFGEEWFDYEVVYKMVADKFSTNSKFVEVGSWKGRSASYMLVEIINSQKNIELTCIDNWIDETIYQIFLQNTSVFKDKLKHIRKSSINAVNEFENSSLDFVFLDGDHSYDSVTTDISIWLPKIKPGGILAGHDYHPTEWSGVVQAVNEKLTDVSIIDHCWIYNV